MLSFGVLSDIHISNWLSSLKINMKEYVSCTGLLNENCKHDYLIIPGDITENLKYFQEFLNLIHKNYKGIFLVLGNHDLYLLSNDIKNNINNTLDKISMINDIISQYNNVKLLNGNIEKVENIKITGLTNWYNVHENNFYLWKSFMLDSKYIKFPFSIIEWKEKERKKLEQLKNEKVDIFISHIMLDTIPTIEEGLPLQYINSKTNDFFYSEKNLFKKYNINVKYHLFGHTHDYYNFERNNTKYICNPLGYPIENFKNCNNKIFTLKI